MKKIYNTYDIYLDEFFYSSVFFSLLFDLPPNSRGKPADPPHKNRVLRHTGWKPLPYINDFAMQRAWLWHTDQTRAEMQVINVTYNELQFYL
jgi:hypothetical protein